MLKIKYIFLLILIGLLAILFSLPVSVAQDFPDVCQQAENILVNCNFDSGLDHWQTFLETGSANISVLQGGGECHAPLCPAAYVVSDNHFIGGLYQQVAVVKGNSYYANIVWLVFDSLSNDAAVNSATGGIGRRIGIDPFGGTDSRSPNVVWSTDNWRNDCKICNIEHVTITAQADTITVFLRIDDTWKLRAAEKGYAIPPTKDQFWIDDLGLKLVEGVARAAEVETPTPEPAPTEEPASTEEPTPTEEPAPTEELEPAEETETTTSPLPTPTNTSIPSADTPAAEAATATEVAQLQNAQVEIVSVEETATPPADASPTPAPPPTLTPTTRPSPTATLPPVKRNLVAPALSSPRSPTPEPELAGLPLLLGAAGTTACLGGAVLLVAALILAGLVWLYRLGWGNLGNDEVDEEVAVIETAR